MSARAESIELPGRPITAARGEHISLESNPDLITSPLRHPHRRTILTFTLKSALRGSETDVSLLEDHYLAVRSHQSGHDIKKYVLDLRFANPRPVIVRHIAWLSLALAVISMVGTISSFWWAATARSGAMHPGVFIGSAAVITMGLSVWQFLRRTTESLGFTSVHGGVTLVRVVGGIGSAKAGRDFFVELIKSISAAKVARAQSKQEFLRDEMREHYRLRELRVLTDHEYESSKARILAAHS